MAATRAFVPPQTLDSFVDDMFTCIRCKDGEKTVIYRCRVCCAALCAPCGNRCATRCCPGPACRAPLSVVADTPAAAVILKHLMRFARRHCNLCDRTFTMTDWEPHAIACRAKATCPLCRLRFGDGTALLRHVLEEHPGAVGAPDTHHLQGMIGSAVTQQARCSVARVVPLPPASYIALFLDDGRMLRMCHTLPPNRAVLTELDVHMGSNGGQFHVRLGDFPAGATHLIGVVLQLPLIYSVQQNEEEPGQVPIIDAAAPDSPAASRSSSPATADGGDTQPLLGAPPACGRG